VLTEAIFDTYESGKTFEEREQLAVLRAPTPRKNTVIRRSKHWSSDEEQTGSRNELKESVFIRNSRSTISYH
jgi:hypothetical protein